MNRLHNQQVGTVETVIAVLVFNVIMLMLLELPLIGYATRPEWTAAAVQRFNDGLTRHGGQDRADRRRRIRDRPRRSRDHQLVTGTQVHLVPGPTGASRFAGVKLKIIAVSGRGRP